VFAHAAILKNSYADPEFAPVECETAALAGEPESQSALSAESLRFAQGTLTAIDFEVAAALSLCGGWHADWKADVYLVRTLERIADHLKALKATQATAGQSRDANSLSVPTDPIAANARSVLIMMPR
jgi:hypothetical protein